VKQISNGPHPTSAANEAIKSSQPDDHPIIENGLVKDLRQLPPLPLSEQSTPRAGSPVAPPSEPSHEHVNGHAEVPPPQETPETSHHAPHSVSTTSPRSSLKYDKVSVSPLDQPPQSDRYERGFSSLSLGGNAAFGGGFSSTGPTSSFASTSQSSWGRTYDEPEENPASSWGPNEGHAPVAAVGSMWDGGHTVDRNGERQSEWVGDAQSDHTNGEAVPQPAQSHQRTISTSSKRSFGSATRDKPPIQQMFTITLSDPTKVGDPIRGHVVYTITTRVSIRTGSLVFLASGLISLATDDIPALPTRRIFCSSPFLGLLVAV
jgi:sorting nexin-1/2